MAGVVTDVPAEVGAVPDPSYLAGRVAQHDVFPGELVEDVGLSPPHDRPQGGRWI